MNKINQKIKTLFGFALALSIGFPVGVLGIIFGAINGNIALLVTGIVLAVAGFYVMPILWVMYGEKRRYRTVLNMIENEHLYTVQELCNQLNHKPDDIRKIINYLIITNCLTGYLFNSDTLTLNENKKQTDKPKQTTKCSNCGAPAKLNGDMFVCEYCGHTSKK